MHEKFNKNYFAKFQSKNGLKVLDRICDLNVAHQYTTKYTSIKQCFLSGSALKIFMGVFSYYFEICELLLLQFRLTSKSKSFLIILVVGVGKI